MRPARFVVMAVALAGCARVFGLTDVSPPDAPGASTWSQVAIGRYHTCGIQPDQSLWCWGRNDRGELGLGDTAPAEEDAPTLVDAGPWIHACAVGGGVGALFCWGDDSDGQIGDQTTRPAVTQPEIIVAGGDERAWLTVDAGVNHTCAIDAELELWCWGENADGECGRLPTEAITAPAEVGAGKWAAVSLEDHASCGITTDNSVQCWGANTVGELGNGTTNSPNFAASPTAPPIDATELAAGGYFGCAIDSSSRVSCWGDDRWGQLGDGTGNGIDIDSPTPLAIPSSSALHVAAGEEFACALDPTKVLSCWGRDEFGQLGIGSPTLDNRPSPAMVNADTDWTAISAGRDHACAIKSDASLWCWGDNLHGELGTGTAWRAQLMPVR